MGMCGVDWSTSGQRHVVAARIHDIGQKVLQSSFGNWANS